MEIKLATKNDIEKINKLYKELFYDMAKLQPEYLREAEQDVEFIKEIIESNKSDIFIAIKEENLIGFVLFREQETPPYNCFIKHRYVYVFDLIVSNIHRGKGIGSGLLRKVKEWGKIRNLDYVELNVLAENSGAIKLYEKNDFKNVLQTMRYRL